MQLRDKLRREMFIEQKSISMAFPFGGLTDEEMTNALSSEEMTRLAEATNTIVSLEKENKVLKDSVEVLRTVLTNEQSMLEKLKIENENLIREKQNHEIELLSARDEIRNIQIINEQMFQKNQEMEDKLRNLAVEIEYQEPGN